MKCLIAFSVLLLSLAVFPTQATELQLNLSENITSDDFIVSWSLEPEKSCYNPGDKVTLRYTIEPKDDDAAKRVDGRTYTFGTVIDYIEDPMIKAKVYYKDGGGRVYESSYLYDPNHLDVEVLEWDYGLERMEVTVTGVIPSMPEVGGYSALWVDVEGAEYGVLPDVVIDVCPISTPTSGAGGGGGAYLTPTPKMFVSPAEFKTDIYQGSNTEFGIFIEESSGLASLKNVHLYVVEWAYPSIPAEPIPKESPIPAEWISFDKNHFDIPAGGKATVNCTIRVPKDAEAGEYFGLIAVDTENDGYEEIDLTVNVLNDTIPPEIVIYSPRDGEVVYEPYVTIKGVARDNIGIKSLEINREEIFRLTVMETGIERRVSVPFEQEMQLEKGWNHFTIEAEDFAGNKAEKTVSVKYEPTIIATPTPIPTVTPVECTSDAECVWCGQECVREQPNLVCPAISPPSNCECECMEGECSLVCRPIPEPPEPEPNPNLENLRLSIHPKYAEAKPGDTINYTVTIDWYPPEWRGDLRFHVLISAAGFKKEFDIRPSVSPETNPPVTNQIPVPIPENILPLTYKVKLTVKADNLKAGDETKLKVVPMTPGFGVLAALIAGGMALTLRWRER